MKILVLDIETSPNLGWVWGLWDQNIHPTNGQLVESQTVLCFAARWLGKKKVHFYSDHHHGHEAMVQAAWDLLDQADAVIHFNGRGFDIKHLNREFFKARLGPPSPHRDIDLLTVCRSRFKFPSNKLDYIAQEMELGSKVEHAGMPLWIDCMQGKPAAWATMKKYNIGDIQLTEDLYYELLPWIKNHPHAGSYNGEERSCPNCGGTNLHKNGWSVSNASTYQRYRCASCGANVRDAKKTPEVKTTTRGI